MIPPVSGSGPTAIAFVSRQRCQALIHKPAADNNLGPHQCVAIDADPVCAHFLAVSRIEHRRERLPIDLHQLSRVCSRFQRLCQDDRNRLPHEANRVRRQSRPRRQYRQLLDRVEVELGCGEHGGDSGKCRHRRAVDRADASVGER